MKEFVKNQTGIGQLRFHKKSHQWKYRLNLLEANAFNLTANLNQVISCELIDILKVI